MKRILFLIGLLCPALLSYSQTNIFPLPSGNVGIGTGSPSTFLHVVGNSFTLPEVRLDHYYNNFGASTLQFRKARGTAAAPTSVLIDDYMIGVEGWGYSGTTFKRSSYIVSQVTGTPTALGIPSDLIFATNSGGDDAMEGMRLDKNGNLGIGTTTPAQKLHIKGETLIRPTFETIATTQHGRSILDFKRSRGTTLAMLPVVFNDKLGSVYFHGYDGTRYVEGSAIGAIAENNATTNVVKSGIHFSTNDGVDQVYNYPKTKMYITASGNVLINPKVDIEGNLDATSIVGEGKLQVSGLIRAKEVKVETANWPDFVFAKDYKLPTLRETERQIKKNGHLPGIPSAAEAEKNGIELGEMNKKLLQKIEELTLHLIEKDKELSAERKVNEDQEQRLQKLEALMKKK